MSNIDAYPLQDGFETTLAQSWNGATGTVYLNTAPSFTFPSGVKTYIVVNPGKTNMQVGEIDSMNVGLKTVNVSSISVGSGAGTTYTQESHSVGSTVIISDNYQFWKNIIDAVNSKMDLSGGTFTGDVSFSGTGTEFRLPNLTTAERLALTPGNGTIVYDSTLGENYQYIAGAWNAFAAGSTQPNASTTVAGKVELATDAEITAGTATGGTGASLVATPEQLIKSISLKAAAGTLVDANEFVINQSGVDKRIAASLVAEYVREETLPTQVAGENLTANDLAYMDSDGTVWKTVKRATTSAQIGTTTGVDSSLNYNPIQTEYLSDDKVVVAYKKSSDDRIYARIVTFSRLTPTVGTEQVISTAMNGGDGVNMCVLSASLFVVSYRKLADTFQYAVACTVSGTTITAGSEVLMYGTAVSGAGAISGSICKVSATSFMSLPVANTALDPIAIIGTVSGTVITAGSSVALEATTMGGSTRCCYIQDGVVAAFWDNSTNIRGVILEISGTTITANTVLDTGFAGSLLGGDRVLYIEGGRILIIRNGNNIIVNTVNVPDQVAWTTMTVSATSAYVIPNDNTNSSYTCALYLGNNILAIANQKVGDGDVRFRTFDLGMASAKPIVDVTIAATAGEMSLAKLNTTSNKFMIAWRETGTTNANYSVYWDTSAQFVGAVKTTTAAAGNVPIISSGAVPNTGLTAGLPYYVGDAGAVATSGTRQIGTALSTTSLLLN